MPSSSETTALVQILLRILRASSLHGDVHTDVQSCKVPSNRSSSIGVLPRVVTATGLIKCFMRNGKEVHPKSAWQVAGLHC